MTALMQFYFSLATVLFIIGIVYGYSGGIIPSVAVMIGSTIGATIFGIAALSMNKQT